MTASTPPLHAAVHAAVPLPSAPAWRASGGKLLAMLCASVLVLGLAGCGGGGGGQKSDSSATQRAAVSRTIETARSAVGALTATSTDAALRRAEAAVQAAKTAIENADALSDHEKEAYDTAIAVIEGTLDDVGASIRSEQVAKLKAALAADPITVGAGAVTVVHGAAPTMGGTIPGSPPTTVTDLRTTVVAGSAVTANGWAGGTYTAEDSAAGTADEVVLYTDIEPPETRPFSGEGGKYGADEGIDTEGNLVIGAGTDATLIASAEFPTGPGIVTHEANSDGVVQVAGTFDGAAGAYECTPAMDNGCTSSIRSGGGITLAGGDGWKFVPDEGATVSDPDAQYRYFGWWLRTVRDGSYAFGAFGAGVGDDGAELADLPRLQGTATYSGPAAGRFVIDPLVGAAESGVFTAEATLEVDFGDVSAPGTVTGAVERFVVNGQSRNWSVELQAAAITAAGGIKADAAGTARTMWSIDGVARAATGSPTWGGRLHEADENLVPSAATGTFEAVYGEFGWMAGAFGATRRP